MQNTRIEKEVHYQYLKMVIEHVNIALFCFGPDGEIQLINKAAKKLLRIPGLRNINDIGKIDQKLLKMMQKHDPEKGGLVKTVIDGELLQLSLQGARFKLQGKPYAIFSLQNIKNELEEQELESWQKLIRVLTHEIMNSATPVSSLSTAINEMLLDEKGKRRDLKQIDPGDLDDMYSSLKTIEDRSKGLLEFVSNYKNLTRLPKPHFIEIYITDLLHHVETLMKPVLLKNYIQLSIKIQKDKMILLADQEMIERLLINLLLNAVDALKNKKNPVIEILALETNRQIFIQVKDNGKGINEDTFEKIFIPFFTTKKQGSGIGLSLSRQIMRLHKGKISVTSNPGEGTIVTLAF
ncbi:Adaptive-response sensory-kinase SasA [subsurface metagenome]